jgi:hypothetical protein
MEKLQLIHDLRLGPAAGLAADALAIRIESRGN